MTLLRKDAALCSLRSTIIPIITGEPSVSRFNFRDFYAKFGWRMAGSIKGALKAVMSHFLRKDGGEFPYV